MIQQLFDDKSLNICGPSKSELRAFTKRKAYTADPNGVKQAIKDNINELELKYNGQTPKIFEYLMGQKDKEIQTEIAQRRKKKDKELNKGVEKIISTINTYLKLEFPNTRDKDRYLIYDPKQECEVSHYDIKKIEEIILRSYADPKDGRGEFNRWSAASEKICTKVFQQNAPRLIPSNPDQNLYLYNTYVVPEFRKIKQDAPTEQEKKLFLRFIKHLIPLPEQRRFVLAWVYTSLSSRQETFLCLVGKHGVGKTMFMNFVSNLHGLQNTVRPKDPNAQFNHYLSNKSLIIYDEVEITSRSKETFKRIANKMIQVEQKGEDQRDVENNSSIILATNYPYMLHVEPSDRRFSIPDLGDKRLESVFNTKEASQLHSMIEDLRIMSWFYDLLMDQFNGKLDLIGPSGIYRPSAELKDTTTFEDCCMATAPQEITFLVGLFRKKDQEGEAEYKMINIEGLIEMYKNHHKNSFGTIKRINKGSMFYSHEHYTNQLKRYRLNGEPIARVEGDMIFNNIIKE